jgi:hypothetical protein
MGAQLTSMPRGRTRAEWRTLHLGRLSHDQTMIDIPWHDKERRRFSAAHVTLLSHTDWQGFIRCNECQRYSARYDSSGG